MVEEPRGKSCTRVSLPRQPSGCFRLWPVLFSMLAENASFRRECEMFIAACGVRGSRAFRFFPRSASKSSRVLGRAYESRLSQARPSLVAWASLSTRDCSRSTEQVSPREQRIHYHSLRQFFRQFSRQRCSRFIKIMNNSGKPSLDSIHLDHTRLFIRI